jgi:hypothetical protein
MQSPLRWSVSTEWKRDYCNVELLSPEELKKRRDEWERAGREVQSNRR